MASGVCATAVIGLTCSQLAGRQCNRLKGFPAGEMSCQNSLSRSGWQNTYCLPVSSNKSLPAHFYISIARFLSEGPGLTCQLGLSAVGWPRSRHPSPPPSSSLLLLAPHRLRRIDLTKVLPVTTADAHVSSALLCFSTHQ